MRHVLLSLGTGIAAAFVVLGLPPAGLAQLYFRPVAAPPPPPIAYSSAYGPNGAYYGTMATPVPPVRYSFYEVPSPVQSVPGTVTYYIPGPVAPPAYQPGYYPYRPNYFSLGYSDSPLYYNGYYSKGFFRY